MKYYKDDILSKYTAKFKNQELENKFHEDLYSKVHSFYHQIYFLYIVSYSPDYNTNGYFLMIEI